MHSHSAFSWITVIAAEPRIFLKGGLTKLIIFYYFQRESCRYAANLQTPTVDVDHTIPHLEESDSRPRQQHRSFKLQMQDIAVPS